MKIGFWTPLPPQKSGIADYSFELLPAIQKWADVTAVVRDEYGDRVRAPENVQIIEASDFDPASVDVCVYQMGNNPPFHSFMLRALQDDPGLLVLHDPSLVDFYSALCRNVRGPVFRDEVSYNCPEIRINDELPTVRVMDRINLDRMKLLMSRRVITSSMKTLVHSPWIRDHLTDRFPEVSLESVHLGAPLLEYVAPQSTEVIFGVFGGVSFYKRVMETIRAFREVHTKFENTRLVIAGRIDEKRLEREINDYVAHQRLGESIDIRSDLSLSDLERVIQSCHVAISLRWPTAGEMSATLMRAFGAGRPAIVSDLPQFRHFDDRFCWRVPIDPYLEHKALVERMISIASDSDIALSAGKLAHEFVASNATYDVVNDTYRKLVTFCASQRDIHKNPPRRRQLPRPFAAFNARHSWTSSRAWDNIAFRTIRSATAAGVLVALSDAEAEGPLDLDWLPLDLRYLQQARPHRNDLSFGNLRHLVDLDNQEAEQRYGDDRYYRIFFLDDEPPFSQRLPSFANFDEIWVQSNYVKGLIDARSEIEVVVVPPLVECPDGEELTRADFGLPERSKVVLIRTVAGTGFDQKNTFAAIDVFQDAFSSRTDDVLLVVQASLLDDEASQFATELRRRVEQARGVLIEDDLTPAETVTLVRLSDVIVSLHHVEAFGIQIAEAMLLGKAVMATNYSGNTDYLDESNGAPVKFSLQPIAANQNIQIDAARVGEDSLMWAQPDHDDAVRQLRQLVENEELRSILGARAHRTIVERFSRSSVGLIISNRLEAVTPRREVARLR